MLSGSFSARGEMRFGRIGNVRGPLFYKAKVSDCSSHFTIL
jgi:hypothetical protein